MLESALENKIKTFLIRGGALVYKLSFLGMKGAPDRMAILENGKILFFEIKRPGLKKSGLSPKQKKLREQWLVRGVEAYVIDDFEEFKEIMVKEHGFLSI